MPMLTALDIMKRNSGRFAELVEEVVVLAPELALLPGEIIPGTTLEVSVRTGLPTVEFRNANEGVARSKSTFENRLFQTFILDTQVAIDVANLKGSVNAGEVMAGEVSGTFEAVLLKFSNQFYYGNPSASDKGFPGLIAQTPNDAAHVVNATGTTAKTSVWGISVRNDGPKVHFANGEAIGMSGEWRKETVTDAYGKFFTAMVNDLTGRVGMSVRNKNRAFRCMNIGTDTNKGFTPALADDLVQKAAEAGTVLTHFLLNPRSQTQYQKALQAVSTTGTVVPLPTHHNGIPFVITNGITNAE